MPFLDQTLSDMGNFFSNCWSMWCHRQPQEAQAIARALAFSPKLDGKALLLKI